MANIVQLDLTGQVNATSITSGANLPQQNLQHRARATYQVAGGADVAAATQVIYHAYKAGSLIAAYATPDAVPAGGTKAIAIDLKRSAAGGAWTTVLSSTLTIDGTATARTPIALSPLASVSFVAGDALQLVITASGTGGTGVQGLLVDVLIAESGS